MRRHSGMWMMRPGHVLHFNGPEYLPMVATVSTIGYQRQPPAFHGDTAVIYRGVFVRTAPTIGIAASTIAETPDGYSTPQNALRAASAFYREATETRPKLPPNKRVGA